MFRDKTFNLAFLISLSWHLFCMFCITIVVLPANFPMAKVSKVSFLGPILEKTAFELMLDAKTSLKRTLYREPMYFDKAILSYDERGLYKLRFDNYFLTEKKQETKVSASELFGDFKFTPSGPFLVSEDLLGQEGTLSNREILFKPDLPKITKRIDSGQGSFVVELKFRVSTDGKVDEVILLASSGYPDIDMTAINYIKGFQFSSLGFGGNPVWDKVRLNLKAK